MSKGTILFKTAERLGLQETAVLQKAEEFLRAFQAKAAIKSLNDLAKTVLCLDLSSSYCGYPIDKESAIKLSGLKRSAYLTNLNNVEKILELNKPVTIANLSIQLNCTNSKELAEEIYSKYTSNLDHDNHPQYVAAALYTACKSTGVKVDQTEFIRVSRIKPSQWKSLVSEFQVILNSLKNRKKQMILVEMEDKLDTENQNDYCDNLVPITESEEGYEEWKERILKEAREKVSQRKYNT